MSVFDRDSRKCFRVVSQGETKYSLDVWMGGSFGDASISFYGVRGTLRLSANAMNAWGTIVWNKELETVALELHDLSLLRHLGDTRQYKYTEFLDSFWDKICDALEESR